MRSAIFAAVSGLVALVSAQSPTLTPSNNYSTSGELEIDIDQIPLTTRMTWCTAQMAQCPLICGGRAFPNTCDANTTKWNCTCSNGNTPNISDYQQTVPSFICDQWFGNCVKNHPDDAIGQEGCMSVKCGNKTIAAAVASSVSSALTASSTGSPTTNPTGSTASSAAPSTTTTNAAIAMHVAQTYGSGILVTGLLAFFGFVL